LGFIENYIRYTSVFESPSSFWKWSAYGAIAAVMRDNCFLKQGDDALYPNMYILLLADSAVQRKGRPVRFSEKLVTKVGNTKIISGKASIQGIIDAMVTNATDPLTGKVAKGGAAVFFAEELAASLVADPQAVSTLTNMFDFKEKYTELLRTREKVSVTNMVFSLIAASNEDLLKQLYDKSAVQGGLLGRTFLIIPNEFRKSNTLFDLPNNSNEFNALVAELMTISNMKGSFTISEDAKKEYTDWYGPFRTSYKDKGDRSGIVGRIHTGILKLSFVLAVNELTLNVSKAHIEEAINECIALIPNYNTFIFASGKSTIAEAGGIVINDLLAANHNQHTLTRKEILRSHWKDFDSKVLDEVIVTLELGGHIKTVMCNNELAFTLTDYCLNFMKGT
jgi:hypothetical protein